jgi:hypothetical protein
MLNRDEIKFRPIEPLSENLETKISFLQRFHQNEWVLHSDTETLTFLFHNIIKVIADQSNLHGFLFGRIAEVNMQAQFFDCIQGVSSTVRPLQILETGSSNLSIVIQSLPTCPNFNIKFIQVISCIKRTEHRSRHIRAPFGQIKRTYFNLTAQTPPRDLH